MAVSLLVLVGCEKESTKSKSYPEIVSEREETITVASEKLYSLRNLPASPYIEYITSVFAIKKDNKWVPFDGISNFEYTSGYESVVKVNHKYLYDPRVMDGSQYWEEYHLVEVISSVQKESEGLPESFLPRSVSNEGDDMFCIYPAKFRVNPVTAYWGEAYCWAEGEESPFNPNNRLIQIRPKPDKFEDNKDLIISAKITTEQGLEREINLEKNLSLTLSELFTADDRSRVLALEDGKTITFKLSIYDKDGAKVQDTDITFTRDKSLVN